MSDAIAGTNRTLGGSEVDNVAVRLEHVDLLDSLDGLSAELLEGLLELLVVGTGASGSTLNLTAGSTLSTIFESIRISDPCLARPVQAVVCRYI